MKTIGDIRKSTRHSKIIGQFGEQIVCNWLSRCGFEVAIVDHTGLDLIAHLAKTKGRPGKRLGISVKARTRHLGTESWSVTLFRGRDDRNKLVAACKAFGCVPWIAVYVEGFGEADIYLTTLARYEKAYRGIDVWRMNRAFRARYAKDPRVKHLHLSFDSISWKWT